MNSPIVLVVGAGGIEDEYNGNDSLDYILNVPTGEEEIIEGEMTDAPTSDKTQSAASTGAQTASPNNAQDYF